MKKDKFVKIIAKIRNSSKIKNIVFFMFCVMFVGGYGFFLTSSFFMAGSNSHKVYSPLMDIYKLNDKEIQIVEWQYSQKQKLMEIILKINSQAYDSNNQYSVNARTKAGENLECEKIFEDPGLLVVHIKGVQKNFKELSFRVSNTQSNNSDGDELKLYTNSEMVKRVEKITDKNKNDYIRLQLQRNLQIYKEQIQQYQNQIKSTEQKIDDAQEFILTLEEKKKYQIDNDLDQTNNLINNTQLQIESYQNEIIKFNEAIEDNNNKIKKVEQLIEKVN